MVERLAPALAVLALSLMLAICTPPALHYWLVWVWWWVDGSVCK